MKRMDYEELYRFFLAEQKNALNSKTVDYLGLNLYQREQNDAQFKVYFSDHFSGCSEHDFIKFIREKDMLRHFSEVSSTGLLGMERIDVALKNRTVTNMEELFQKLSEKTELFYDSEQDVRALAGMPITDLPEHELASLYHLGSIERDHEVELLKFHFYTKWCEDPYAPERNSEYRDKVFLQYIKNCGISEYGKLARLAEQLLVHGGNLWMAGLDCGKGQYKKYKLYVKKPGQVYENLRLILDNSMERKILSAEMWNRSYLEYQCEGVAFCEDTEGVFSINLYYAFD